MDQTMQQPAPVASHAALERGKRIAFICANWHRDIVGQAWRGFCETGEALGISAASIDLHEVPGSLEIPLHAKLLAKSGDYALIVAAGLVVDGGIYRHDFVAATVIDALMRVQLDTEVPLLSVVLTPHQFQESEAHKAFFFDHFRIKGGEAARACAMTLANQARLGGIAEERVA